MKETTERWPSDRFYWAVLEAPQWRRSGELPAGLRSMLEEDTPAPAESLHAVCAPIGNGQVLVCALDQADLKSLSEGIRVLAPEALPEFVTGDVTAESLNLLVGRHEPMEVRRSRLRKQFLIATSCLMVAGFLTVGFIRRAQLWQLTAEHARSAATTMSQSVKPGATPDVLALETSRTRRLAETAAKVKLPDDAALALEVLLRAWPGSMRAKPESIVISDSGLTLSVMIEGDPTQFLEAMRAPPGWTMDEPRLSTTDAATRLTLHLRRLSASGGPS